MLVIGLGVAVYAAEQGDWLRSKPGPVRHARLDGSRLVLAEEDGRILHYYDLDSLDYLALRSGRRSYTLHFGFEGESVSLEETDPGVEAVLDALIRTPPPGADLSRFGEAMETRRAKTFVFLDRTRGG